MPIPNHCVECDKPTMNILCDKCKEKEMGKVKGLWEEDIKKNPELYNGHADEEFWTEINKKKSTKRRSNVRKRKKSS